MVVGCGWAKDQDDIRQLQVGNWGDFPVCAHLRPPRCGKFGLYKFERKTPQNNMILYHMTETNASRRGVIPQASIFRPQRVVDTGTIPFTKSDIYHYSIHYSNHGPGRILTHRHCHKGVKFPSRSLRSISVPLDMHNFEPVVDDDENRQRRVAIRLGHAEKPHLEFDPVFYRSPSWRTNRHKRMYGTGWLSLPSRLRTPIINHLNDIATCSLKF